MHFAAAGFILGPMRQITAAALALFAIALLGAGRAEALTLEPVNPSASGNGQQFSTPAEDAPIQRLTERPDGSKGINLGDSGLSFSITGGGTNSFGSSSYLDPSRSPQLSPYGFGASPFLPYRR